MTRLQAHSLPFCHEETRMVMRPPRTDQNRRRSWKPDGFLNPENFFAGRFAVPKKQTPSVPRSASLKKSRLGALPHDPCLTKTDLQSFVCSDGRPSALRYRGRRLQSIGCTHRVFRFQHHPAEWKVLFCAAAASCPCDVAEKTYRQWLEVEPLLFDRSAKLWLANRTKWVALRSQEIAN